LDRVVMPISIGGRVVGPGHPCYVIAEAGVNHNGDIGMAKQLIDHAIAAGADAIKFQSFKAEEVTSAAAPKAAYQIESTGDAQSQQEMLRALELSSDAHGVLAAYCAERGITFLSTPFDQGSVDLLAALGIPVFKVGSGEITNLALLRHIASVGKPVILSTGMSYLAEVGDALATLSEAGASEVVLLHCTTEYPAPVNEVNLRAMATMVDKFRVPVGYSDHTDDISVSVAAVALGACVIEKHFTLDRNLPGPDHLASLEPADLARLVRGVRDVESAMGNGVKEPAPSELRNREIARRSIVTALPIREGAQITDDMLKILRPGTGIPPAMAAEVTLRRASRALPADHVLQWDDLA
jgi:N-acetylneuraminate synthase